MRSELDKSNMFEAIQKANEHIRTAWDTCPDFSYKCDNVVFCGMGGSAIAGDLIAEFVEKVPFTVNRAYKLPHLIDKRTLVIVNSYSGNTEETLSAFKEAMNSDAQILCLASGGQIAGMAKEHGYNLIELPNGLQPRAALFFSLIPVVKVLWQSGLLDHANEMVDESAELISQDIFREKGEKLAQQLKDKIPIVYADESIKAVAMRWKTQANENAKMPAFYNTFSEMNHNELCQYPMLAESFAVIFLRDEKDHERIQKRFEICKDIIQNQLEEVWAQGVSKLARIASLIHIGDWYSYYLALLREKDPSPVDTIEGFKKKL